MDKNHEWQANSLALEIMVPTYGFIDTVKLLSGSVSKVAVFYAVPSSVIIEKAKRMNLNISYKA